MVLAHQKSETPVASINVCGLRDPGIRCQPHVVDFRLVFFPTFRDLLYLLQLKEVNFVLNFVVCSDDYWIKAYRQLLEFYAEKRSASPAEYCPWAHLSWFIQIRLIRKGLYWSLRTNATHAANTIRTVRGICTPLFAIYGEWLIPVQSLQATHPARQMF